MNTNNLPQYPIQLSVSLTNIKTSTEMSEFAVQFIYNRIAWLT